MGEMIWFTDEEAEELDTAIHTLDHLTIALTALTTLPDATHVEALRAQLPAVRDTLMRVWRSVNAAGDSRGED